MSDHIEDEANGAGSAAHGGFGPRIEISAVSDLSYAMAHCRIPVIDHITVHNTGTDQRGAVLEVDVVSADGSHGGPREVHLDLAAYKPTVSRSVDLQLDPTSMLRVTDQRPGSIRAVLRDAQGDVIAQASNDVNILAADQWKASPPQLALEMLAAYVQPNSASITALMPELSDRLKDLTGKSAIDGYQSEDPARVDAIARAVFDAMRSRDIRYAEPPASWGLDGQKIRTPAEVLDGRLGTCLDTTLTMAAILEQCGINTTIWVLHGHAFLGYWRTDSALDTVSTTEAVDVVNQVDLGHIGLVETTMATQSSTEATFDDASRNPRLRHLSGDLSQIIGVTDVKQARYARVLPLPSRSVDESGNVVVTQYEPGAGPVIAPYQGSASTASSTVAESVPPRISNWKNALLDLSLRSRLINYTERAGFRLEVPGSALARLEDEINAGAPLTLLPSDEISSVDSARGVRYGRDLPERERELLLADKRNAYVDITDASYKGKLRYLANKARTIVEETGANNLYLAFGMLNWRFNDRELRSPLVLVPVNLSTKNRGERYTLSLDEAGASTPNYCLVEKLRLSCGLEIPELANPAEDASGIDLVATFDAVRQAIARAGLHFRVEETVHLSILQFAKYPLWKDLDESWKELSHNSLVRHLIETPLERFVDPVSEAPQLDLDALGTTLPIPADSSQLGAVADSVGGRTFVLEGPPGTGKSQTITNLLAHAMASGRRVLFVAEKRAALDVVKKRLEAVGLGELSLDLHDKSARPAAVRTQIRDALDLRLTYDQDMLRTQQQTAESSRLTLDGYARKLHATNAAKQSLYSARSRELAADREVVPLEVPQTLLANSSPETFQSLETLFRSLPTKVYNAQPRPMHAWGFIDVVPRGGFDVAAIHRAAVEFDATLAQLDQSGVPIEKLAAAKDANDIHTWARIAAEPRFPLNLLDALNPAPARSQMHAIEKLAAAITTAGAEWLGTCTPNAMALDVPAIHQAAVAADESSFFGRKKRRRAVLAMLAEVMAVDPSTVPLKSLSELTGQLNASYDQLADFGRRVGGSPLAMFGRAWNPLIKSDSDQLRATIAVLRRLVDLVPPAPSGQLAINIREFYSSTAQGDFAPLLAKLASSWEQFAAATGVSYAQQSDWAQGSSFIAWWWQTRAARHLQDPESLTHWAELIKHVEPLRGAGMLSARAGILNGEISAEDAALAFDYGSAKSSVAERLDATRLADFDVAAHMRSIARFTSSTKAIREELRRAIPAQLLAERRFDADTSSGQVGGLRRQLDRKRGGMSVRALMANYGDLITRIMPCTLMSPDSVARFFPAGQGIFDIVVFDEASQIRVADAIGAMGRANSVVVVGDSKQMPPTSFAEASVSSDDDEDYNADAVADEESILTECVHALVPQQWLSWHYRSQDEALIAFSNFHYYSGQLASFPAPLASHSGHGISLVRVDGHFQREGRGKELRTNRVEAERIVEEIRRRFAASPVEAPSVGVITFNAQQRDLIENLLRDAGDDRLLQALDEPDGLFVKNLENVQGDERDTILFSVAFSKNARGLLPLNFGPLSKPGGERRLNVAITRARREVVLYASFDPSELRAEETSQLGTKHLKAYLEMAKRGVEALAEDDRRQPVIDRHRDEIADALRDEGFAVSTDVGLSDFRIDLQIFDPDDSERPLVAVLLDGQEWFGRRTVADRDGLPVDVLQNLMKWPVVERVWMPEWLSRRDQTLQRLREAVTIAKARLLAPPAEPVSLPPRHERAEQASSALGPLPQFKSASSSATESRPAQPKRHSDVSDYREWGQRYVGTVDVLDEIHSTWAQERVRAVAKEVIDAEAPIHRDRLARLVANAFGLGRVNEGRRLAIQRLVPAEHRREQETEFYWPVGVDPRSWRTVRVPRDGDARVLEEVSLIEIGNAMLVVAEQTGGIDREELKRKALSMFGGRRMTQAIGSRLDDALNAALALGLLRLSEAGLVHPG